MQRRFPGRAVPGVDGPRFARRGAGRPFAALALLTVVDLGIKGRSALVFGGSRGIGRAVAGTLATEGANVAVCARKDWAARRVAAEAAAGGGVRTAGYRLDARDEPSAAALVDRVAAEFGAIDILFGIARPVLPEDGRTLSWSSQLENGFLRFKAATETVLPGMRRRRWGRVLWMIPYPTERNGIDRHVHSVASAALHAWLRSAAGEAARENVILNVLVPGPVRRPVVPGAGPAGFAPTATLSAVEVAAVAAFLLSDRASGLYGRTLELGDAGVLSPRRQDFEP